MPADAQLLTKSILAENIGTTPVMERIKFHLGRGQIARVLGFHGQWRDSSQIAGASRALSVHFRKSVDAAADANPTDLLWSHQFESINFTSAGIFYPELVKSFALPKPYRTTGILCQIVGSAATNTDWLGIVYYDVDSMTKDEDVQYLESTRQRGIGRVA